MIPLAQVNQPTTLLRSVIFKMKRNLAPQKDQSFTTWKDFISTSFKKKTKRVSILKIHLEK